MTKAEIFNYRVKVVIGFRDSSKYSCICSSYAEAERAAESLIDLSASAVNSVVSVDFYKVEV